MVPVSMRLISRSNPHVRRRPREMYPCIPSYAQTQAKDPFDYPLRSKQEVMDEFKYIPALFDMQVHYKRYTAGDVRPAEDERVDSYDNRERVAKVFLDIRDLRLAPLQRKRFQYLLGPRHDPKKPHDLKIVYGLYDTYKENYIRCFETLRELYWEAKRAPDFNWTMQNNPYRREKLIKQFYGKTAEERKETRAKLKQLKKEHWAKVDAEEDARMLGEASHQERVS